MIDYPSKHWRERAKELKDHARTMRDSELRMEVEMIAERYERLADLVAKRDAKRDPAKLAVRRHWDDFTSE